jgi:sigma-54 dependent transcriptional regulator, acetoin dehydrogenase operon transcriptional activator AcoR
MESLSLRTPVRRTSYATDADLRDRFLARPAGELSGLRPLVARSWHRSRAAGVDPYLDRGFTDEGRVDEPTMRSAESHLRALDQMAAEVGGYVSLTSPNGSLVKPSFLRDDVFFPPGYSLLEASCGSNGEGVALEEGTGVWLAPEEHFREDMRGNWCFASLIRDPFHDRVRAVVGLTLPAGAEVRMLEPSSTLLMLEGITARIEREIENRMSSRERGLLKEYLRVSRRRSSAAIVATDGKHAFMNAVATASFDGDDLAVVTGYAKSVMSSGGQTTADVVLAGPGACSVEVSAVALSGSGFGAVIAVRSKTREPEYTAVSSDLNSDVRATPSDARFASIDGTSIAIGRAVSSASSALEHHRSAIILGEPGVGKQHLAAAMSSLNEHLVHLDARIEQPGRHLADAFRASAGEHPMVVIAHADELVEVEARDVAAQLRTHQAMAILTAAAMTESMYAIGDATGALEVHLAPLRRRREDIAAIAIRTAAEVGARRLSKRVTTMLTSSDWPGNVAQLRQVVLDAAARAQGIEIGEDDLPPGFHHVLTGGRLSRLEDVELAEIRSALRETRGNRRVAAEVLEIGRSTLYRRMDYFRSRGFDL